MAFGDLEAWMRCLMRCEGLEGLSEDERSLMTRCYVEGWTHQELAEAGNTTPKAVESKLARLRRRLRSCATTNL